MGHGVLGTASTRISHRRENVACRRLCACRRRVSVTMFFLTFSPLPFRLGRKLRDESVGLLMYSHLVCSPELLAVASGRKLTRKLFRQAAELMFFIDHEFVGNSTSPSFAFLP